MALYVILHMKIIRGPKYLWEGGYGKKLKLCIIFPMLKFKTA